jgi:hypothetical protein
MTPDNLDQLFEGMTTSVSSNRSDFFLDGRYLLETKSFEYRPNGHKGTSFIAQFKVLSSDNPAVPVGSTRSWVVKLDGPKDQRERAMGDIKNLFFSLLGKVPSSVPKPEVDMAPHIEAVHLFKCSIDENYAAAKGEGVTGADMLGIRVELEATLVDTRPKTPGGPVGKFTRHSWSPASDATS